MKRNQIISHRGGFLPEGPISQVRNKYTIIENTLEAFNRAFENDWGIEIDIRINTNGDFIIIHDFDISQISNKIKFNIPTLEQLCKLVDTYNQKDKKPFIAFQVKRNENNDDGIQIGLEIAKKIEKYNLKNSILFDTTFEEAKMIRKEFPNINLSVSVGENNYNKTIYTPKDVLTKDFINTYNCIWADEWKIANSIYNKKILTNLRKSYKGRIDIISPELHYDTHPFAKDLPVIQKLWKDLLSWEIIDGICTDYPSKLQLLTN